MSIKIDKITVENYKGIDSKQFKFQDLFANKLNILVAPNGYGKSSLAASFDNLIRGKLSISEEYFHNDNNLLLPKLELEIEVNGQTKTLTADSTKNDISRELGILVINSKIKSFTRQGHGTFRATSYIGHEEMVLVNDVPENIKFSYKISDYKKLLSRKQIPNLFDTLLDSEEFLLWFLRFENKKKLEQQRPLKIIDFCMKELAKADAVLSFPQIESSLNSHEITKNVFDVLSKVLGSETELNRHLTIAQLLHFFISGSDGFIDAMKRTLYIKWKERIKSIASMMDGTSYGAIDIVETAGKLKFNLKNYSKLSNGQRDVLSFFSQLFRAEYNFIYNSEKYISILIIDEIFDYLDEANILTCQYFIIRFIDHFKKSQRAIFPLILTHLSPSEFGTYRLSKKIKVHFLKPRLGTVKDEDLRKVISARGDLNLPETERNIFSKHFLHYNDTVCTNFKAIGLSTTIKNSEDFCNKVLGHLSAYLNKNGNYDPISVCTGLRLRLEKKIYDRVPAQHKNSFLSTFKSLDKFEFAESVGVDVPEIYYLLGIVFNEAAHIREQNFSFIESKLQAQLENQTIYDLIKMVA